jgi:histidinol-phosphatase (PHP family)
MDTLSSLLTISNSHTHTCFSFDSYELPENMVKAAVSCGCRYISITEHMNVSPTPPRYCRAIPEERYKAEIERVKGLYSGKITVLRGIEYDNPQLFPDELEEFGHNGYDVIIGSVHTVLGHFAGDPALAEKYSREEILRNYYDACIRAAYVKGYDVVGHFGLPLRIMGGGGDIPDVPQKAEALRAIAECDLALEINTSGFKYGLNDTIPKLSDLQLFKSLGGKKITVGSDAHRAADCAEGYELLSRADLTGLTVGVYIGRKFTPIFS